MKSSVVIVVVAAAILAPCAFAQEPGGAKTSADKPPVANVASSKPITVSGRITADGKGLVSDIDSEWLINNPEAIKGHEGRRVTVRCYVDSDRSRLHILRVKPEEGELKYAIRHDDSAFRR